MNNVQLFFELQHFLLPGVYFGSKFFIFIFKDIGEAAKPRKLHKERFPVPRFLEYFAGGKTPPLQ